MAARGAMGLVLDLDRVPVREDGMEPFEIMISESQERMLAVVEPDRLEAVAAICARWELACTAVGELVAGDQLVCRMHGEVVGELPVRALVDDAPRYRLDPVRPDDLADGPVDPDAYPPPADLTAVLKRLLAAPNVASKAWVHGQYDQLVGSGTVLRPGGDAGVVRLTPSDRAIAVALDGNGRRTRLDPRRGAQAALCESARNVACAGAEPIAVTNCLNFGNPERGETPFMLTEAVEGLGEACRAFELPVVSGNVSLYNEHAGGPIPPTPVVGCLGVLERADQAVPSSVRTAGDAVLLFGDAVPALDGSEYQRTIHGHVAGRPPAPDLDAEARLCALLAAAAHAGLLRSAHDASDGGLAVALAETATPALGLRVGVPNLAGRADVTLFGEGGGLVVASTAPAWVDRLVALAGEHGVPYTLIGSVTDEPRLRVRCGGAGIDTPLAPLHAAHAGTLPAALGDGR
jgi:phosphoribosylformylglycinamidine synthase